MKNKKSVIIMGAFLIVLVVGIFLGYRYNIFVPKAPSNVESTIGDNASSTGDEDALQKEKEEAEKIQKEKEEAERIAKEKEEAKRKAAEEARQKDINENTFIAGKKGLDIYDSLDAETQSLISTLDPRTKVYISDYIKDEAGNITSVEVKSDIDAPSSLGFASYDQLVKSVADFISRPYEDADYSGFDKNEAYEDNPQVHAKGLYLTGGSAAGDRLDEIIDLIDHSELNTVVIDVKDDNGYLLFHSETAERLNPEANKHVFIDDIESFMSKLKEHNIYAIARIVTFKSPLYAKANLDKAIVYKGTDRPYTKSDGIYWVSPHNRDLWEYNLGIAKEAADLGFNEIQFDYVRFPVVSNKSEIDFRNPDGESQAATIQNFLKEAYTELSPKEVYVAADVFGWAATAINDVGMGQHWEAVSNVVDYICPMMYPSHYGKNNFGLSVPDAYPYETIDRSTQDALMRNENAVTPAKIRPWIQDFTATWVKGHIRYGKNEVLEQIKALHDNGIEDYILWNPYNKYSKDAFLSPTAE